MLSLSPEEREEGREKVGDEEGVTDGRGKGTMAPRFSV